MKIDPPTEIIEEGKTPEQEPKKRPMSKIEYDFAELRGDFNELREKLVERYAELKQDIKSLTNKINSQGNKINGYSIKELAQLKALGIKPQSILTGNTELLNEETQEKGQNGYSKMPKVQRDNFD